MKKIILILAVSILIFSCEDSNNIDNDQIYGKYNCSININGMDVETGGLVISNSNESNRIKITVNGLEKPFDLYCDLSKSGNVYYFNIKNVQSFVSDDIRYFVSSFGTSTNDGRILLDDLSIDFKFKINYSFYDDNMKKYDVEQNIRYIGKK